ncbi:hypothetical protein [Deinococcus aetherius]|nr:hypothetical protein [Deinococcus aetherius]
MKPSLLSARPGGLAAGVDRASFRRRGGERAVSGLSLLPTSCRPAEVPQP